MRSVIDPPMMAMDMDCLWLPFISLFFPLTRPRRKANVLQPLDVSRMS